MDSPIGENSPWRPVLPRLRCGVSCDRACLLRCLAEGETQDTRLEDSSEEVLMHGPLALILRLVSCRLVSSGGFRLRLVFELVGGAFTGRDVTAFANIDRLVNAAAFPECV